MRGWEDPESLLGVDEARAKILAACGPLPPVALPLLDALGLVLADDVAAPVDVPPFQNSAMDGYAVRAADLQGACPDSPVALPVTAAVAAGDPPGASIVNGGAARIMTGAPMPEGADAVVRFEETDERSRPGLRAVVRIERAVVPGENVRDAGEDIRAGQVVLGRGRQLRAVDLGLLAALNYRQVTVHRRPRVGILSTGNEVRSPGDAGAAGTIRDSNSYTLAGLVQEAGGEPLLLGVARDEIDAIRRRLQAAVGVDLLLTSGGVSLGDYDLVKDVLAAEGRVDLWQVRIKPGKPMAFGHIGAAPLLGLPGNPVAAAVAFLQFARPAIKRMLGLPATRLPVLRARLSREHENRGRRRHFVRGIVRREGAEYLAEPAGAQGSGVLTSMAEANCLIVLPETWDYAPAGAEVEVELLPGTQVL